MNNRVRLPRCLKIVGVLSMLITGYIIYRIALLTDAGVGIAIGLITLLVYIPLIVEIFSSTFNPPSSPPTRQ